MPARKSSPTKGKKSPKARSKSRSRSRSRSAARKPAKTPTRSRSRSAGRTAKPVEEVVQKKTPAKQSKSPARPSKIPKSTSPARTKSPPRIQQEEEPTPTRVSRRIQEKTTYQDYVQFTPPLQPGADNFITPPDAVDKLIAHQINDNERPQLTYRKQLGAGCTPINVNPLKTAPARREVFLTPGPVDLNNNAVQKVTRSSVTSRGDGTKAKPSQPAADAPGVGPGNAAGLVVLFVIGLTYYIVLACSKTSCAVFKLPKFPRKLDAYFNLEVTGCVLTFYAAISVLTLIPVGAVCQGPPLRDGRRLNYRCNGWLTLLAAAAAFGYSLQRGCPMDYVSEHMLHLVTTNVVLALVGSLALLIVGRNTPAKDRSPGSNGTFLNDYWMGRELNPRIGADFDLKFFMFRAGTIMWVVIDWMYVAHRFKTTQTVEPALAMVVLFQTLYCLFVIKNEHTWLTSNDFMVEGLGFMFMWAAAIFIPFTYSLQARFLYLFPEEGMTNKYALGATFLLNAVGLLFFVGGNWQKNEFRKNPYNPELSHLSSIQTPSGKRLLCSGWWGIVRRPNYLGDLMIALAMCLPCGCSHVMPYFYFVYLVILLVARVINDEKSCHQRYGDAWIKYTETVPYRLIPYVF